MRCELSKICIVPADCSPGEMGLRKREALRGGLPDLCRAGTVLAPGSTTVSSSVELDWDSGIPMRSPVCSFSLQVNRLPQKRIFVQNFFLRYRKELLERIPCLEIRMLGHCTFCTKNECSSLDSVSQSVLADPITSRGSEHELNEL